MSLTYDNPSTYDSTFMINGKYFKYSHAKQLSFPYEIGTTQSIFFDVQIIEEIKNCTEYGNSYENSFIKSGK